MGPRCFVTTNYDNLIEEGLRKWRQDIFFRPPITNRQLTETAEIVHARAIDFIFKPHGDAGDSDTIILTREQYRRLLPGGDRQAALESLKMILASRPVVYFGFGLRDPDFMYVRDLLANTYKGGIRDHYAVMADVSGAESDYWRRNYGIHLVSYPTTENPDKTRNHAAFLNFLDSLISKAPSPSTITVFNPCKPDVILSMARHAAGLSRSPQLSPEFQIRIHAEERGQKGVGFSSYKPDKYNHYPIEKFLDEGPARTILVGLPGAGKTYSLRRAAARLAEKLYEVCISSSFDEKAVVVPIYADLKLYHGDIGELVEKTLPKDLTLQNVTKHFKVKIFLDSFNEMPREYLESGDYESDFAGFIDKINGASIVIGSRTTDGLEKLEMPAYYLDEIDEETVETELQRLCIEIEGRFEREVRRLLQRPFYFQYVLSGIVNLPKEAHPIDFYRAFFTNLRQKFNEKFRWQGDIEKVLSLAAYDALNRGEEAFLLVEFLHTLKMNMETDDRTVIDVLDVANWLVSTSILIPYTGGRVAFVHQSITEYLAACELSRLYQSSSHILQEKLSLTRWDQALFLTLSLLPAAHANEFLKDVIKADFELALTAAKYLEVGRKEVVSELLKRLLGMARETEEQYYSVAFKFERDLPIENEHESYLRDLMKCGGIIGASAVVRLGELKGVEVKDELLQLLFDFRGDFSFCVAGIAEALKKLITVDDTKKIAEMTASIQELMLSGTDIESVGGFLPGAGEILSGIDLSVIRQEFFDPSESKEIPIVNSEILCYILRYHGSTEALDFAGELLLRGVNEATISIYCIAIFPKPDSDLSWASYTVTHVDRIISFLCEADDVIWGLKALSHLCAARPDLLAYVEKEVENKSCLFKAALMFCISGDDFDQLFDALNELTKMNDTERKELPFRIIQGIDLDWAGREELFVRLLRLRDAQLGIVILGRSIQPRLLNLGILEIGPIDWWLEWIYEVSLTGNDNENWWFCEALGLIFAGHLSSEAKVKFISELNKRSSKYRGILVQFILPYFSDISTDVFNEDAISFLLSDLNRDGAICPFSGHLLGNAATEQFIYERLLPLLPDAKQPFLKNIKKVLKQAGSRHGKRYVIE